MLENLRRKSLTKTYHDPIHQVHFELGFAHYENHLSTYQCINQYKQRFSKENVIGFFQNPFAQVSNDFRLIPYSLGNVKFNMIVCPNDAFTMGHEDQDGKKPRTEIIDRSFLLGETEVTQELYEKVMRKNLSHFKNDPKNPVDRVSWVDAIIFCNKLSDLQGLDQCYTKNPESLDFGWDCDFSKNGYRLPIEKEWEYAAKAGTENRWAGTDKKAELQEYAWFEKNSKVGGEYTTHLVATKKPNEWGFYDMSGNLSEWCWDKYNPKGNANAHRVLRGGGFNISSESDLCSAHRNHTSIGLRAATLGFRICRSIVN